MEKGNPQSTNTSPIANSRNLNINTQGGPVQINTLTGKTSSGNKVKTPSNTKIPIVGEGSTLNEKILLDYLEEIKQKNTHVQKYFLLKETAFKREIEDLKGKLKTQIDREKILSEEVDDLKVKLAFFAEDVNSKKREKDRCDRELDLSRGNDHANDNTTTTNTSKRGILHEDSIQEKESPPIHPSKMGRPPKVSLSTLPDMSDFNTEEKFVHKYSVPRLKSYALLLKDIGLDCCTFYDDLIISNKELEDDICYECPNVEHKCGDARWNYAVILRKYPKLKNFILLMAKKLLYDNRSRLKLEEKTLKIFSNDLKAIDQLVILFFN
jgi:hypothetical protein